MQYLIKTDEPFNGYPQSILLPNGTVAYTDGMTLEEYVFENGPMRVLSEDALDELVKAHEDGLVTDPQPETEENWFYALNVLPPCRWERCQGVELFHVSELITGSLANWHARLGEQCFAFVDRHDTELEALAVKVKAAAEKEVN